jgi:pimeloyl-ACP methyl ester carboxylesterase
MFRDLIPRLADRFHVIAPDLSGFGQSDMPERTKFSYSFENIADAIDRFTEVIGLDRFATYVFDYGAPTGFRLTVRHPDLSDSGIRERMSGNRPDSVGAHRPVPIRELLDVGFIDYSNDSQDDADQEQRLGSKFSPTT